MYDPLPAATAGVRERFPFVGRVFGGLDEVLGDPEVDIVDIATRPDARAVLIERAAEAGKHVLAQKPLAPDLASARALVAEADAAGVKLAVNQNGRWAPPWRLATLLVERGAIGDAFAVTHLLDKDFAFAIGTRADELEHFLIYDYCIHWIDITRCWLETKTPAAVRAVEHRLPNQPPESRARWGGHIEVAYDDGTNAVIRSIGGSTTRTPSCPFWIHGSEGTIRGSILGDDFVELERGDERTRYRLEGAWYVDGFAGAIGELLQAIDAGREPYNSARHNLLSLELTLAACRSSDADGAPVAVSAPGAGTLGGRS